MFDLVNIILTFIKFVIKLKQKNGNMKKNSVLAALLMC